MKEYIRLKSFFIIIGILFALFLTILTKFSFILDNSKKSLEFKDDIKLDDENLKNSKISGNIHIYGNSGWEDLKNTGNCTGSGTNIDPYLIKDLIIDGGGSEDCILIEYSDVYFKIENCTTYNSGSEDYNQGSGIKLRSVSNGLLLNNNDSINNWYGIYLSDSDYNTISGNNVNNNNYGIYLSGDYNTISGNNVNNNNYGIYLSGVYNTVSGNNLNRNDYGIYLSFYATNNIISGNLMSKCGLSIIGTSNQIDTTNLVNGKPLYYYNNKENLEPYNFTNAGQVILINCNNSLISNLNISYINSGISLRNCFNNIISENIVQNNIIGIHLTSSDNNTISENFVNINNSYGIYLDYSSNNMILGNEVINNMDDGIHLTTSDSNTISGNIVKNNKGNGIYVYKSLNNMILGNEAINNTDNGIYIMYDSNSNEITGNTVKNNNGAGIYTSTCDNIKVIENMIINNSGDGIHFYGSYHSGCNNNVVLKNNISGSYYGIHLSGVNNTLSGNKMVDCGLKIYGYLSELRAHIIDPSNLVNEKPLYYYVDRANLGPSDFNNAGQIILVNCEQSLITNLDVSFGSTGISLYYSNDNNISEIIANNNRDNGIFLQYSNYDYISGNTANNNHNGIYLDNSNGNTLSGNTVNNNSEYGVILHSNSYPIHEVSYISGNIVCYNYYGIYLGLLQNVQISGNNVSYNHNGIYLDWQGSDNTILQNIVSFNYYGIYLSSRCDNNVILRNIIDNNEIGINLQGQTNTIKSNTISNNVIGIRISYTKCNKISDNIFSGNIEDIQGKQDECNPFPIGIVVAIVIIIIVMGITGLLILRKRASRPRTKVYPFEKYRDKFQVTKKPIKEVPYKPEVKFKSKTSQEVEKIKVLQEEEVMTTPEEKTIKEEILLEEETSALREKSIKKEVLLEKVVVSIPKDQIEEITPPEPQIVNCPFCGLMIDELTSYCPQCGMKLKKK
ncbi:MAG: right-handed parallel beta-helix repeat-containing protein [Candidatus Odinarchaeota archaeon]